LNSRWLLYSAIVAFVALASCTSAGSPSESEPYSVQLSPSDFVAGVNNPYFPLVPGSTYVYELQTDEGLERTEVQVLTDTRSVFAITATVVRDTVTLDGELVEDTYDWYAQDASGNVWYLGEDVSNFEGGRFVGKAGSWEAGVDGALPGIIMFGDPSAHIGETYRQEYYAGEAEDMADLLSVNETVTVPFGSFSAVLKTLDYTPLEPGVREEKFYAPGIGPVKTVNLTTGEEDVLLEFTSP
jgi:hypothetical protein